MKATYAEKQKVFEALEQALKAINEKIERKILDEVKGMTKIIGYEKIQKKYPEIYSLDHDDYNLYYMPDNSVADSFIDQESL